MNTLSKYLDPDDYVDLADEVAFLASLNAFMGQHPQRKWEYSMAIRAIQRRYAAPEGHLYIDVGGGGSLLCHGLAALGLQGGVIDPISSTGTLEEYKGPPVDVLTCISTLEHVEDVQGFARLLRENVVPGGLLFLTTDAKPDALPGIQWTGAQIFSTPRLEELSSMFSAAGMEFFGGPPSYTYYGAQVYDYSFFSFALVRV